MGVLLEQFPRTAHVRFGRPQVADREAEHELPSSRVCERNTSPLALTRSSSRCVDRSSSAHRRRQRKQTTLKGTGATARSRDARCHPLLRTAARAACVRRARARSPVGAEVPHHHPQLQRAEAASELDAGVHQIPDTGAASAVLQIFRRQRERLRAHVHAPAVEHAEIERREQPLVRIDDERVGRLGAVAEILDDPGPSRQRRRRRRRRAARSLALRRWRRSPRPDRRWSSTSCRPSRRPRAGREPAARSSAMAAASASGAHAELVVGGNRAATRRGRARAG